MTSPSKEDAQLVAVKRRYVNLRKKKKEVFEIPRSPKNDEEIPHFPLVSSSKVAEADEDEICSLSGNRPFFDVVLAKSHVKPPWKLWLPNIVVPMLPREIVPVVLRHGGKTWNLTYIGNSSRPRFDTKWKEFVTDNNLKARDACVFELMESTTGNLIFKVIILRGYLPPELQELVASRVKTPDSPIVLD